MTLTGTLLDLFNPELYEDIEVDPKLLELRAGAKGEIKRTAPLADMTPERRRAASIASREAQRRKRYGIKAPITEAPGFDGRPKPAVCTQCEGLGYYYLEKEINGKLVEFRRKCPKCSGGGPA